MAGRGITNQGIRGSGNAGKREAVVVAKEQAPLERLQEKRDAALFAILGMHLRNMRK